MLDWIVWCIAGLLCTQVSAFRRYLKLVTMFFFSLAVRNLLLQDIVHDLELIWFHCARALIAHLLSRHSIASCLYREKAKKKCLFAKIRPGEIIFWPTRRRKLSTFYFFANHTRDLFILAMNYSWSRNSFYAIKHCTIRAVIGMATPIHH